MRRILVPLILLSLILISCGTREVKSDTATLAASAPVSSTKPILSMDSTSAEIQQAMLLSASRWQTIWLDGVVTWYAQDGSAPQVYHEQVWIDQMSSRFRILMSGVNADLPETLKICDGNTVLEMKVKSGETQSNPLPDFAHAAQFVPTLVAGSASPNPLWGQIGTPLSEMVFAANYAQNQGIFKPVSSETIAGRKTLAVEWTYVDNSQPSFRAWLDVETGVILKLQEFGKGGGDSLQGERIVEQVAYDTAFDAALFGPPSVTPLFGDITGRTAKVRGTEAAPSSGNDPLGQLYFFTLPHQTAQSPQMVRLPGSCALGLSPCPQLESMPAPFPFSFNLSALAWSPDGKLAAFAYSDNANGTPTKLWVLDPSANKWTSLAQFPFIDPPFWSPDGAWIAFRVQDGSGGEDVYVVRRDGTELKKLTASGSLPTVGRPYVMDGWLAGDVILRSAMPGKEGSVYLMSASDGIVRPLFKNLLVKSVLFPSHDGTLLAFDDTDGTGQKHVLKMTRPDATDPVELATFSGGSIYPVVWSPDDSRLAFVYYTSYANNNPSAEVYLVGRDGRNLTQVYKGATVGHVIFSPDGKFLLVEETTSPTGGHLFAINLETLKRKILSAPGLSLDTDWYAPSWRP